MVHYSVFQGTLRSVKVSHRVHYSPFHSITVFLRVHYSQLRCFTGSLMVFLRVCYSLLWSITVCHGVFKVCPCPLWCFSGSFIVLCGPLQSVTVFLRVCYSSVWPVTVRYCVFQGPSWDHDLLQCFQVRFGPLRCFSGSITVRYIVFKVHQCLL